MSQRTVDSSLIHWSTVLIPMGAALISIVSYAYSHFANLEDVQKIDNKIESLNNRYVGRNEFDLILRQLDRMEKKIDHMTGVKGHGND